MLSMSRLLKNTILLSSLSVIPLLGADSSQLVEDYLSEQIMKSPAVESGDAKVIMHKPLKDIKGWDAYIVKITAKVKHRKEPVYQKDIFFSNGKYITNDFINMKTGISLKNKIKPKMTSKFYTSEHLVSGYPNAKHRVAIFSDPLCPFCRDFVPEALKYMKKYPNKYAVYYYHLPLQNLHPASVILVKAVIAAEVKGKKIDLMKLYQDIQPDNPKEKNFIAYNERNEQKILNLFNKVMGTHITKADIKSPMVTKRYKAEKKIAQEMMVSGTPTVYFDDEYDKLRNKYKKVK